MPIASWILAFTLAAVPPLTPAQQGQLQTAADNRATIDEGALYPLLHNAEQWGPNEEVGARVPEYERIEQGPAESRGELFLIEGSLQKWDEPARWFTRGGSWDGRMQRWIVAVGPREDRYVIVYLVAPAEPSSSLRRGHRVRMAARFYKVWHDADAGEKAKDYLTFVGRDARVVRPSPGTPFPVTMPIAFLIAVMGLAWFIFRVTRRSGKVYVDGEEIKPYTNERERGREEAHRPDAAAEEDEGPPLPRDPTAALIELSRRAAEARKAREGPPAPAPTDPPPGSSAGHAPDQPPPRRPDA